LWLRDANLRNWTANVPEGTSPMVQHLVQQEQLELQEQGLQGPQQQQVLQRQEDGLRELGLQQLQEYPANSHIHDTT